MTSPSDWASRVREAAEKYAKDNDLYRKRENPDCYNTFMNYEVRDCVIEAVEFGATYEREQTERAERVNHGGRIPEMNC